MKPTLPLVVILAFGAFAALSMHAQDSDISAVRAKLQEFRKMPSTLGLEEALDAAIAIPVGVGGPVKRDERLVALLEVLQQIQQQETPDFDPKKDPRHLYPLRIDFPDGFVGDGEFLRASEEHEEKVRVYNFQRELLSLKENAILSIERFVRRTYTQKERPRASALIESNLTDAKLKKAVLDSLIKHP